MTKKLKRSAQAPALIGRVQAADLCGVSLRMFNEMNAKGLTPKPILREGQLLWRQSELKAWAAILNEPSSTTRNGVTL
jgi:predicted DNA-binding transcriptional regulator AlpA